MDEDLREYRKFLIDTEQQSQDLYDKTVISLSGGAIAVSFAFYNNFVTGTPEQIGYLIVAWISWGASVTAMICSLYLGTLAFRKCIDQVDEDTVFKESPGGYFSESTKYLNITGGLLFFVGVIAITIFVICNA